MVSDRVAGVGMIVIGFAIYLGGLAQLFSGGLMFTGGGKHLWFGGFLTLLFGRYAFAGAVFFAFCLASFFVLRGIRTIQRNRHNEQP